MKRKSVVFFFKNRSMNGIFGVRGNTQKNLGTYLGKLLAIVPKPELRGFGGDSLTKAPFGVASIFTPGKTEVKFKNIPQVSCEKNPSEDRPKYNFFPKRMNLSSKHVSHEQEPSYFLLY